MIQGSSTSSARSILRRRAAHLLLRSRGDHQLDHRKEIQYSSHPLNCSPACSDRPRLRMRSYFRSRNSESRAWRSRSHFVEVQDHAWIFFGEPFNDVRDDRECDRQRACNPDFARCRISQEFDVPDALLQFVEHCNAAFEQRVAIHGRLDALRGSIEKSHAERMLEIGDHFRDRRLGNSELYGRLGHAAVLGNREKHMQVAQPAAAGRSDSPSRFFSA